MTWKWRTLTNNHIAFDGTEKEFDEWKSSWFRDVPKCEEFACCHELMSCGIAFACGDCSIYSTMIAGRAIAICDNADCADCTQKYTCTKPMNTKTAPEKDVDKKGATCSCHIHRDDGYGHTVMEAPNGEWHESWCSVFDDESTKLTDADRDKNLFIQKTVSLPNCEYRDSWLNCTKEDGMDCIELLEFGDCPLEKEYDEISGTRCGMMDCEFYEDDGTIYEECLFCTRYKKDKTGYCLNCDRYVKRNDDENQYEISLCSECGCMTKAVDGMCGKCGANKERE